MENLDSNIRAWVEGIPYELAFCNNVCRWTATFNSMMQWSKYGKPIQLAGFDANAFLLSRNHPVVLDVGCGMSFANGDRLVTPEGEVPLEVHYIDPLAHYYNKIKAHHHRQIPDVEYGMMECLSGNYGRESASLVLICNALDHSANPMKGILEAMDVLETGGCLYLNHHPNEAEAEHYKGFHKFNICIDEQERLVIWNKEKRIIVNELLEGFADITTQTLDNGFVVAVIRKTAQVPDEKLNHRGDKGELTIALSSQIEMTMRPWNALRLSLKYLWFNAIQFFVQALSWEGKQRLRRLVYRRKVD